MPLHCYRCPVCDEVIEEYRSIQEGGNAKPPLCPQCNTGSRHEDVQMVWVVPVVAMDAKEPGQRFEVTREIYDKNPRTGDVDRHQQVEVIDSVHKMRQIERDSEQRYRNGEGEPMRFRALSQGKSNLDVGLFGREGQIGEQHYDSGRQSTKKANIGVTRHGTKKPKVVVARGGGVTALKG